MRPADNSDSATRRKTVHKKIPEVKRLAKNSNLLHQDKIRKFSYLNFYNE